MLRYKALGPLLVMLSLGFIAGNAFGAGHVQEYFNSAARAVEATPDPAQKRELLSNAFDRMSHTLIAVQAMPLTSSDDRAAIGRYVATIQERHNELDGVNGYTAVADKQLNAFSHFVVQDMEQADQMITISLVTLLLIIILVFLIAR